MGQPEKHRYDRSSKWLIQHFGDSMLRISKIGGIEDWRPAQAEVVQPRQLQDGLLKARLRGESTNNDFLLEVTTYADRRTQDQLTREAMLVYLDSGELPEVVVFVLAKKGKQQSGENLYNSQQILLLLDGCVTVNCVTTSLSQRFRRLLRIGQHNPRNQSNVTRRWTKWTKNGITVAVRVAGVIFPVRTQAGGELAPPDPHR